MTNSPISLSLGEFATQLALDTVTTQRLLDLAWAGSENPANAFPGEQRQFFRTLAAALPQSLPDLSTNPECRDLLAPMAPARLRVASWEVECRLEVHTERERAYGLYLHSITALWERRYGSASTHDSRLRLTVMALPFPVSAPDLSATFATPASSQLSSP